VVGGGQDCTRGERAKYNLGEAPEIFQGEIFDRMILR